MRQKYLFFYMIPILCAVIFIFFRFYYFNQFFYKFAETPFFGSYKVLSYTLNNGLKVLIVEDHSSPTFAFQTWYNVGSKNEISGKTGLAHLFEHMMFKGTKNLKPDDFDRILESAGGEGQNAFTTNDYTAYIQELPSLQLELIIKLESERMTQLTINPQSLKTEIEVVKNERRFRHENNPESIMQDTLMSLIYTNHAYRWPIIGYVEDLESITTEDAISFYSNFYNPKNATVVIVGDVNPQKTMKLIENYYGSIQAQNIILNKNILDSFPTQSKRKILKLNVEVEKLLIGYMTPESSHPDSAVLDIIQNLLTGGKSTRLEKILDNEGITSSVAAYNSENKDPSFFIISANLQKNMKAELAEKIILNELNRLEKQLPNHSELERAKNKILFDLYTGLESNEKKAHFLGHYQTTNNHFIHGIERINKMKEINNDDIRRVLIKYFKPESRSVIIGIKK